MSAEVESARGELGLLRTLQSAKQLSLLSELRALYPIEEIVPEKGGRTYTIRGLHLPSRDLAAVPEEQLSTALGYVCHLVQLTAKYLAVPLRYTPAYCASRSAMRDDVLRPAAEFPLHGKLPAAGAPDAAAAPFAVAILMLARDVRQLLHSQGLAMGELHMLGALRRLYAALLDGAVAPLAAAAAAEAAEAAAAAAAAQPLAAAGTAASIAGSGRASSASGRR